MRPTAEGFYWYQEPSYVSASKLVEPEPFIVWVTKWPYEKNADRELVCYFPGDEVECTIKRAMQTGEFIDGPLPIPARIRTKTE